MVRLRSPYVSVFILVAGLCATMDARAQPAVEATVNSTEIGMQERLVLTLTIDGAGFEDIDIPDVPSTRGLAPQHRMPSSSSEIRIIDGEMTRILRYSWAFLPISTGTATIDPIPVQIAGVSTQTKPIRITVTDQAQRRRGGIAESADSAFRADDIFIRAVPTKQTAFVNEQVIIEYKLYFREGVQLRQSRLAGSWDAPGFWREELEVDLRPIPEREIVNGLPYQTIVLKRAAMFPTRSGQLSVHPLKIETEARPRHGTDLLDAFLAFRNRYRNLELESPEITIDVRPLPPNPPETFTGAVGRFDVRTYTDSDPVLPGDPVVRQIEIEGMGNIAMIDAPAVPAIDRFDRIEPRTTESIDRDGDVYRGRKSFNYVLVPLEPGTFELPRLAFSYFDPVDGAYHEVESPEILIEVLRPDIAVDDAPRDPDVDEAAGILTSATWSRASQPLHKQPWAYAPAAAMLLAWLVIPGIRLARHRRSEASTVAATRRVVQGWQSRLSRIEALPESAAAFREARSLLIDIVSTTGGQRITGSRLRAELDRWENTRQKAALMRCVLVVEEARFRPGEIDRALVSRLITPLSVAIREAFNKEP